jgi:hypothetical protein
MLDLAQMKGLKAEAKTTGVLVRKIGNSRMVNKKIQELSKEWHRKFNL